MTPELLTTFRNLALSEYRNIVMAQNGLSDDDALIDERIRINKDLPPRPSHRQPYEGIIILPPESSLPELANFRGDLAWLHAREGHVGQPYWPGGDSGVTLDPGVDVGHADPELVNDLYRDMITVEQAAALLGCQGVFGTDAKAKLVEPAIAGIRVSFSQATSLMPVSAEPYWDAIRKRFPSLDGAPPNVQTALLSIAYNRGPNNSHLHVLKESLGNRDWRAAAGVIGEMQQNHQLLGIRRRRKLEAQLILDGLAEG